MRKVLKIGKVIGKIGIIISAVFGFLGLTGCGLAIFMDDEQWKRLDGDSHSNLAVLREYSRTKLNLN